MSVIIFKETFLSGICIFTSAAPAEKKKYDKGRWAYPHTRAKGYAQENRKRVHMWGDKEGQELTEIEQGVRLGYLQCQHDHAGVFKYYYALNTLKLPKEEAMAYSKQNQKKNK